jgi:outer membrane protein assembly factor BamB
MNHRKDGKMAGWAAWRVRELTVVVMLVGALDVGCARESPAPVATGELPRNSSESDLAVLPNNVTILSARGRLLAVRGDGELAWELSLPDGDTAIAPVAVGLNSVAYVRGKKAIHAALPEGKWLWSKPLDASPNSRATNTPVAMSDSTVALVVGDDVIRFDYNGGIRWRLSIPEGHILGRPASGMDGSLLVHTTAGVYSINPEGVIAWRRVVGT